MKEKRRQQLRDRIEREAREEGWSWYRVTVTILETGKSETIEVPGRDPHHSSRINAMFLIEMSLRGETVEYDVEPL